MLSKEAVRTIEILKLSLNQSEAKWPCKTQLQLIWRVMDFSCSFVVVKFCIAHLIGHGHHSWKNLIYLFTVFWVFTVRQWQSHIMIPDSRYAIQARISAGVHWETGNFGKFWGMSNVFLPLFSLIVVCQTFIIFT